MQKGDLIWQGLVGALFGTILKFTLEPLIQSLQRNLAIPGIPIEILPLMGIGSIIGLTVIGVLFILQIRNYFGNKTPNIIRLEKTPNEKLDDLLNEMESFTNKWRYSSFFISSYRRRIEINAFGRDRKAIKKITQYSTNIYIKINLVKKLGVTKINNKLNEMMPSVKNLVGLGEDLREIYWSSKKSKMMLSSDPEVKSKLLTNGDHICGQFDRAIYELRLLREDLP